MPFVFLALFLYTLFNQPTNPPTSLLIAMIFDIDIVILEILFSLPKNCFEEDFLLEGVGWFSAVFDLGQCQEESFIIGDKVKNMFGDNNTNVDRHQP